MGQDRKERLDQGDDSTEAELRELIDDLNEDEIVDLIALVWIGRGDRRWALYAAVSPSV